MKRKKEFQWYTGMWLIATVFLLILLWQNIGDARGVNYSGLVRGATQKLVKEELEGQPNDGLITYLDDVIYDLQTGKGKFNLTRNRSKEYQIRLSALKRVWEEMKAEISAVRTGDALSNHLYELSQQHFEMADQLVHCEEQGADLKLALCIGFYCIFLALSVTYFTIVNRRSQKEIEESLTVDGLTGLLSRRGFEERAAAILHKYRSRNYCIVEFDVDNFKGINNTYGFAQGDRLLCEMAGLISGWMEGQAICARINADDFVLLSEQRETLVSELEELLSRAVKNQNVFEALGDIGFTLGAYQIENNGEIIKTIMDKASTAHKTAKLHKHKSLLWYDESLIEKIELENRYLEQMHQGVKAGEFKMFLQPKVELSGMDVIGAEALVRWEMPDRGMVYPDEYIPLFEKNGSIVDLDYYMLETACAYLRRRLDESQPVFTLSVNFSRVTLYQQTFYDTVLEIVNRFDLPHYYIEIEVTESAFNEVTDAVLQTLQRLRDAGFYISMDDFGAGYSNLNMLSRFPIQIIKLDREFVRDLEQNKNVRGIIACVVDMAHAMGLKVICEGVEREEHVRFLRNIGCDYAQGYYFSRPIPQDEFGQIYQSFKVPELLTKSLCVSAGDSTASFEIDANEEHLFENIFLQTYPGFISLRNEKHQIVYLNDNFRNWIKQYTDVKPLGRTNVELAAIVPENVADTFLQCHDGSMELQKDMGNRNGLKKVIEFKGKPGTGEDSQYYDVLKYWVKLSGAPYIFTIAYDITKLYLENAKNFQSSMTDSLTGVRNRRYLQSEIAMYRGHYAAAFDLDNFKMVNDLEGHITGDKILREFVSFIEAHVPDIIMMIRLGGDEFLAIFKREKTREEICRALSQARSEFETLYSMYSYLSFSAGVDMIGPKTDETLRMLDKRMYEDKKRKS